MSKSKVIVLVGVSKQSWEDAVRQVVAKATHSVGRISQLDVVHQSASVEDGQILEFRVTVHIAFELDEDGLPLEPSETPAAVASQTN